MGLWARRYDIFIICNRRHFMTLNWSKNRCYRGDRPAGTRKTGKLKTVVEEGTGEMSHSGNLKGEDRSECDCDK